MKLTGLKRKTTDKFYTSQFVVSTCIEFIKQYIDIKDEDMCIEPSAGDGAFIEGIKSTFKNYAFYDIEPEHADIVKADFLNVDSKLPLNSKVHVVGNPPFGRQSSMAIKFIKKSAEFADSISFILPKSFKKDSLKRRFPPNFHLVFEYDLPKNAFIIDSKHHDVPSVFQIWIKRESPRVILSKSKPSGYRFVKNTERPDISFRRVGARAGNIDKSTEKKSVQSHYFIKFDKEIDDMLYEALSSIKYECRDNTCGPRSISKQELIREFNKILTE